MAVALMQSLHDQSMMSGAAEPVARIGVLVRGKP